MSVRTVFFTTLICGFFCGHALPAFAQSADEIAEFERLVSEGQQAYDTGDFTRAHDSFEAAERIYAHPKISARIIESRVQLGDCAHATQRLETLRAAATNIEGLDSLVDTVAQCQPKGRLRVECRPSTLQLSLDGKPITCGEEIAVQAGERRLSGQAASYKNTDLPIVVNESSLKRVMMELEPALVSTPPSSDESSLLPILGWSAVGGGVALVATALWIDSGAGDRQADIRKASEASDFEQVQTLSEEADSMRSLSTGLLVGGVILTAGGAGFLIYDLVAADESPVAVEVGVSVNRVFVSTSW